MLRDAFIIQQHHFICRHAISRRHIHLPLLPSSLRCHHMPRAADTLLLLLLYAASAAAITLHYFHCCRLMLIHFADAAATPAASGHYRYVTRSWLRYACWRMDCYALFTPPLIAVVAMMIETHASHRRLMPLADVFADFLMMPLILFRY